MSGKPCGAACKLSEPSLRPLRKKNARKNANEVNLNLEFDLIHYTLSACVMLSTIFGSIASDTFPSLAIAADSEIFCKPALNSSADSISFIPESVNSVAICSSNFFACLRIKFISFVFKYLK